MSLSKTRLPSSTIIGPAPKLRPVFSICGSLRVIMTGELEIIRNTRERSSKRRFAVSPTAATGGYDKAIQLAEDRLAATPLARLWVGEKNLCLDC